MTLSLQPTDILKSVSFFQVAPYCASEWAVEGLTRAVAKELSSGVAIVALSPGVIHTEMLESCFGSTANAYPKPNQWYAFYPPYILLIVASGGTITSYQKTYKNKCK